MKKILSSLTFIFAALTVSSASAVTVAGINFADNAIADVATGSDSLFLNWNPTYDETGISAAQLSADMTDTSAGTYVFSFDAGAYIDMSFSNVDVYNGEGNDLALFFVGSEAQTGTLNLLGTEYSTAFTTPVFTGESVTELFNDINGDPVISPIYVSYFDLDVFGINSQTAINNFRLEIGNGSAVPALLAAINTNPGTTPVPVPAPFLLLLSGLAGLGFFGRKKK